MRTSSLFSGVFVTAFLAGSALSVSAGPILPSVEYSGSTSSAYWDGAEYIQGGGFISGPSGSRGGSAVTSAFASFSSALGLAPMVAASSSASSSELFIVADASLNFSLAYFFEATGPGPVTSIHVKASGASSGNSVQAAFGIREPGFPLIFESPFRNWTIDTDVDVFTGRVYEVDLNVQANAFSFGFGADAASASVDPLITIDPTFPDADQYQLFFSPGVGENAASAVPEPSICAMLLSGLASLGLRRVRLRQDRAMGRALEEPCTTGQAPQ